MIRVAGLELSFHRVENEDDAGTLYDNLSEYIYGDRPNKTEYREIIPIFGKSGSVSFNSAMNKYALRLYDLTGKRIHMGFFDNKEEPLAIKAESDRFRFYRELELFKKVCEPFLAKAA